MKQLFYGGSNIDSASLGNQWEITKKNKMITNFFDYKIFNGRISDLLFSKKTVINTINQYSYCIAEIDPKFKESLLNSDILLPDGDGIVVVSNILFKNKIKKISGFDLHYELLKKCEKENLKCFYLGSTEKVLNKIKNRISLEFPNVIAGFYSPPYKPIFSDSDNEILTREINKFKPDILFIGMTAPKQEKWVHENKFKLNANVICSIGAVFDFYAGTVKRPPKFMINLKLEWFGRLIKEPRRLSKRYLYYGPRFIYLCLKNFSKKNTTDNFIAKKLI